MVKKKKILLYIKLFKFKYLFSNINKFLNKNKIFNFIKIFKILINLKNFGIFIPEIFSFNSNWVYTFWKKGFISNFRMLRWFFLHKVFIKNLHLFLINLTSNNSICLEIKKKNIPLVNLLKVDFNKNNKNLYDYYLTDSNFIFNYDFLFFLIKTFTFLKKYKNV